MSREEFDLAVMLLGWKVMQKSYAMRVTIAIHSNMIWLPTLFTPRYIHIVNGYVSGDYFSDEEYQNEQEAYEMTIKLIGEFKDENR